MREYKLLGVKVQTLAEYVVKDALHTFLNSDSQHQIVTVNPEFIVATQKDKKFLTVINEASLATIDGNGIIKALQFMGHHVSLDDRITGADLTELMIELASRENYKILFIMKSDGLTKPEDLFMIIKSKYPQLEFRTADENTAIEKARIFFPRLAIVGLGAPYQDFWIWENLPKMPTVKVAVGVGGSLDFISGKQKRAPKIWRSLGLEWFWRLIKQPWRITRIWRAVFVFSSLVIRYKIKHQ
ncbi:MAG: hypothetical protein C3F02_04590 [Parcubacteria group bacterium]|nr:MAG: hypothetical protein C3F02_04590 [Parcubacteria group bacterium]